MEDHDVFEIAEGLFDFQDEDTIAPIFFSPERIAEIRDAAAEARIGNNITIDQYRELTQKRSTAWQSR
jgi:hypothetical protein